jgi:hypothetical protein
VKVDKNRTARAGLLAVVQLSDLVGWNGDRSQMNRGEGRKIK